MVQEKNNLVVSPKKTNNKMFETQMPGSNLKSALKNTALESKQYPKPKIAKEPKETKRLTMIIEDEEDSNLADS